MCCEPIPISCLDGLEVHNVVDPVKIQVPFKNGSSKEIAEPEWVSTLGWDDAELTRIRAVYKSWLTNRWSEQLGSEHQVSTLEWNRLYGTLNRDLWRVHQQNGSLVYTPETGITMSGVQ